MTAESLDKLVAQINDYLQRWPYRDGMYSHLERSRDAIVALRARAEELEKRIPTAAVAAMQDGFKAAIAELKAEVVALRERNGIVGCGLRWSRSMVLTA